MTQDEVEILRRRAKYELDKAIKAGQLSRITKRTKCVDCGHRATGYDHRDYYKPLEVEPVCRRCNHRRGAAYPVAEDRYDYRGRNRWNGLNDGEGEEVEFPGRCVAEIDWGRVELDLEVARRSPDPDVRAADEELWRMSKLAPYRPKPVYREIFIGDQRVTLIKKSKWDKRQKKLVAEYRVWRREAPRGLAA